MFQEIREDEQRELLPVLKEFTRDEIQCIKKNTQANVNWIYLIETVQGKYILRKSNPKTRNGQLTFEAEVLRFLKEKNCLFSKMMLEHILFLKKTTQECLTFLMNEKYNAIPKQVIHGDVHLGNLLFTNLNISGIVDFDWCGIETPLWDFAYCFSQNGTVWEGENDGALDFSLFNSAIESYFGTKQISPKELLLLQILVKVGDLRAVKWEIETNVAIAIARYWNMEDPSNLQAVDGEGFIKDGKFVHLNREKFHIQRSEVENIGFGQAIPMPKRYKLRITEEGIGLAEEIPPKAGEVYRFKPDDGLRRMLDACGFAAWKGKWIQYERAEAEKQYNVLTRAG